MTRKSTLFIPNPVSPCTQPRQFTTLMENPYLTFDQVQRFKGFDQFGCSQTTLDNFVNSRLIRGIPEQDCEGFRYHAGDIKQILNQRRENGKKQPPEPEISIGIQRILIMLLASKKLYSNIYKLESKET